MSAAETYDVVVVGSGAAGAMAALRAAERGLSVLVVEKAHKFGGTSATSGGVLWVPNHQLAPSDDNRDKTLEYLDSVMRGEVSRERLDAYLDNAPEMARFLKSLGIPIGVAAWPDYYQGAPSARADRSLICDTFDGRELGEYFPLMREQYNRFKVLGRYSMDVMQFFALSTRAKGWVVTFLKMVWRYWTDFSTRSLSARDRRFTMGAALMGWLYKHVFARGVEVRLDTGLDELIVSDGKVTGVRVSHFGRRYAIGARHGVVLCAGGFEWNQELRERYFPVPGLTRHSSTPEDANRGEALLAGLKIGAATEHTDAGWWIPTMHTPMPKASNFEEIHQAAFDVGRPHSVAVNRLGLRFVDEATGYDDFGKAMVEDQLKTGANTPCWLVFDASFRTSLNADSASIADADLTRAEIEGRLHMADFSAGSLEMSPSLTRHIDDRETRLAMLRLIERSAKAKDDTGLANAAFFQRRALLTREKAQPERTLWLGIELVTGYLVKPLRPLMAIGVVALLGLGVRLTLEGRALLVGLRRSLGLRAQRVALVEPRDPRDDGAPRGTSSR